MKKSFIFILTFCLFLVLNTGCNRSQSAATDNKIRVIANSTVSPNQNISNIPNSNSFLTADTVNSKTEKSVDEGEIKGCAPEKLYRDEILTVKFNQPHGGYLAIQRMSDKKWFFLNYAEKSTPVWNIEEFKALAEIKINSQTAVNTTNSKIAEKIFAKSGKYRIMVSDQDFGQDDPPATGICQIEYNDKKRPKQAK